jgi:hypothetical protein
MLGLVLGFGTSLLASSICWRTYLNQLEPKECRLLEKCLADGGDNQLDAFRNSRPGLLMIELSGIRDFPELAIATLNNALGEVDSQTRSGLQAARIFGRASLAAGVAGACAELAINLGSSALTATYWGLAALSCGLVGTITCTVIGRRAILGFDRRRRLWDEFVQWLLNSQFPRSEMNVLGDKRMSPSGAGPVHNS